jgi:hypothetical protein
MKQLCSTDMNAKEMRMKEILVAIEKIPNYLTKGNISFKQMTHQALATMKITSTKDNIVDLQKIALAIYQIMVIQIYHLLWTTYLKSGMGQLIIQPKEQLICSTNLPIWPKEVKTIIQSTNIDQINKNKFCMNFVNHQLHALDNQLKQYQTELNIKANNFQGYSLTLQQMVETYVANNLHSLHVEIEHKIELIHYDYYIEAIELEYFRHNPNTYQVCFFSHI